MAADILLVDDDAIQAATRKTILDRGGHSVRIASDGREALAFLQSTESRSVRLVITDHSMPGMNGSAFVSTLRKANSLLPIVVLSGYTDVEEQYENLDVTFRVKPFPPDQLIALIQYLLSTSERRTA